MISRAMDVQEATRHHDQAAPFGSRACAATTDSSSDVSRTGTMFASTAKDAASGFEGGKVIFGICRSCRVEQEGNPDDSRRNLL
jgi:hypothetical protein